MKLLSALLAFAIFIPSADAAIIRSTKQKKLPTIANVQVEDDLGGFAFDIVKAPTIDAYDVWGRLTNGRKNIAGEWFVQSMRFRTRSAKLDEASFDGSLADILRYSGDGSYEFTVFACPANVRKPTTTACATAVKTITFKKTNSVQ